MGGGEQNGRKTWRGVSEDLLTGHVQQKIVMAEKISPKDWNRYLTQLKHPVEVTGTKT